MANTVTVFLQARDQISGTLRSIRSNIDRDLGASNPLNSPQGFTGLTAGLGQLGLVAAAIGTVTASVSMLKNQISEASNAQTEILGTSGDVATLTGKSFEEANNAVLEIRSNIAKMAAELPGETKDFTGIGTAITSIVAANSKGDLQKMIKDVTELTRGFGYLAVKAKVDSQNAANTVTKLMGGQASLNDLFTTEVFFQKNPLFRRFFDNALTEIGKSEKDWKTLDAGLQMQVLKATQKKLLTADTIGRLSDTLDAKMSTLTSNLFDPDTGIFGFLRKLKGGRTGLDAVGQTFDAIARLSESVGKATGLDKVDPMVGIVSIFDWFSGIAYIAEGLFNGGDASLFTDISGNLFNGAIDWVNGFISSMHTVMDNINWGELGFFAGVMLGQIKNAIMRIDWGGLIFGVVKLFAYGAYALFTGLLGLIWEAFVKPIGEKLKGLWSGIVSIFQAIPDAVKSFVDFVVDLFGKAKDSLAGVVTNPVSAITGGVANPLEGVGVTPADVLLNPAGAAVKAGTSIGKKLLGGDKKDNLRSNLPILPGTTNETTSSVFAPQISVSGGNIGSPQELANLVLRTIDDAYTGYKQDSIAYG